MQRRRYICGSRCLIIGWDYFLCVCAERIKARGENETCLAECSLTSILGQQTSRHSGAVTSSFGSSGSA
ncbi:hypothetical protein AMEX_G9125 [Astyanax mexicanus]|uniref:Uncharacterized protein n=1 Tax=Astyanax mexicanus TaxID=7994 RepID=A0A8T2LZC5_ASTMX|nr:hypothetical protein AMEX_G9125 [Astyanax mexicanus]